MSQPKPFFFHLIGICSTLSLVMMLFYLGVGAMLGDGEVAARFLTQYPGSEPFLIFALPVMLVGSPAWLWVMTEPWRKPPDLKENPGEKN